MLQSVSRSFFMYGCPVIPAAFVEKGTLYLLNYFDNLYQKMIMNCILEKGELCAKCMSVKLLVKNHLTIYRKSYLTISLLKNYS